MYISRQLKETNIAEYLLYMWQVEDLIRANHLNIDEIKTNIISKYEVSEEQKAEIAAWYEDLIRMMYEENVKETGHLQINKNVILTLTELHLQLTRHPKYPFYGAAYFKALPFIVELRAKSGNKEQAELETCFEALYGVMLLRLQKKEVNKETLKAVKEITNLLSLLANYYEKERKGELDLDK